MRGSKIFRGLLLSRGFEFWEGVVYYYIFALYDTSGVVLLYGNWHSSSVIQQYAGPISFAWLKGEDK